jgi:hypothetical protein
MTIFSCTFSMSNRVNVHIHVNVHVQKPEQLIFTSMSVDFYYFLSLLSLAGQSLYTLLACWLHAYFQIMSLTLKGLPVSQELFVSIVAIHIS